jgi:hypothetical protein
MNFAIGCNPVAEAAGGCTDGGTGGVGPSELVVVAAGAAVGPLPLSSRRLAAAAVHANGAAAGTPPSPPAPSHDNRPAPSPDTTSGSAGATDITGTCAVGITDRSDAADAAAVPMGPSPDTRV